ncbi:hypothetical protein [uncultured Turicimonas sp.]
MYDDKPFVDRGESIANGTAFVIAAVVYNDKLCCLMCLFMESF